MKARRSRRSSTANRRRPRKRDRRPEIIAALYRAMLRKGFSGTSLTDLANGAGISVSHLLYYFPTKQQALAALSHAVVERQWSEMKLHRRQSPEQQCRALADYSFTGPGGSPSYRAITMELMTVANHHKPLREISREHANVFHELLKGIFTNSETLPGLDDDDTALIAGAVWMGLFLTLDFQPGLTRRRAHRLFLETLLFLAGLKRRGQSRTGNGARPTKSNRNGIRQPRRALKFGGPDTSRFLRTLETNK